jgi:hypothetical protein
MCMNFNNMSIDSDSDVFSQVLINTLKTTLKDGLQAHNLSLSILSGVESTRNGI